MKHWIGFLGVLLMASLACTLTGKDNQPTTVPINTPVGQFPTATTTLAPIATPAPSVTPTVFVPPVTCTPRTDWPIYVVIAGDTVGTIAQRTGTTVNAIAAANCLVDAGRISVGQGLRVPFVPAPLPTATSAPVCPVPWFFTFKQGEVELLNACAGPLSTVQATGQDFEGGRVYRYDPLPGSTDPRGTIYVVYNDGTWETYVDTWDNTQPNSDPAIVPPTGLFQPTGGIGKVWRDFPAVRSRLGWAYEPPALFTGRFQQPVNPSGVWPNGNSYWYIDHGKWGIVLRMVSVNSGPNTWRVVGGY